MTLAGALQIRHHLAHGAAGIKLAQPGGSVGVGVIRRLLLLEVDKHHRHIQIPHSRQHVVGGGISQQLQDHKIHIGGAELVARGHGLLLGGDDASVNEFDRIGDARFEIRILALELGDQARELGQVRAQGDSEYADACLGVD